MEQAQAQGLLVALVDTELMHQAVWPLLIYTITLELKYAVAVAEVAEVAAEDPTPVVVAKEKVLVDTPQEQGAKELQVLD